MGPEGWGGTNQAKSRGSFPGKGTACAKALGWENQEAWHRTEVNRAGAEGARGDGGRWGLITWVPSRGPEKTPQCLRGKSDVSGLWGNSPSAVLEQWVEHSGRGWGSQPGGEWFSQQLHLGGQCPQGSRRACSCADVGWTHVASALPTCPSQVTHIRPTKSLWQQYLSWNPIWRQRCADQLLGACKPIYLKKKEFFFSLVALWGLQDQFPDQDWNCALGSESAKS